MATIENINELYERLLRSASAINACKAGVEANQARYSVTPEARLVSSMEYVNQLTTQIDCTKYPVLSDAITICMLFSKCIDAIAQYRNVLHAVEKGQRRPNGKELQKAVYEMKAGRNSFETAKETFSSKYNGRLSNADELVAFLLTSFDNASAIINGELEKAKNEARSYVDREFSVELRSENMLKDVMELPSEMQIARYEISATPFPILRDIGIAKSYKHIVSDLRRNGNVLVTTRFEDMAESDLDSFVIAYILRFIESFPLGTVNVHIFDKNANYLYRRLSNGFRGDKAGEAVQKIVQLHSSMTELEEIKNVVSEDVFRKTTVDTPDLFSIYENDQTDAFNLIVLRNGLVESNGYAATNILEMVNSLSRVGDIGHKCGMRFLIIDDSSSFAKTINAATQHILRSIQNNCGVALSYANHEFMCEDKKVETLKVVGSVEACVQERSQYIATMVSQKERAAVSLEDVRSKDPADDVGSVIYIPVGKSGQEVVELPLSCRDDNGTVAGQCIGYMAIGQSGSGKSSFFHSVVLNSCMKYSPKELQFWLLDFKYGGASSKYGASGIPHIHMIAENNKVDDALCLFQMVSEEMDRRNKAFNSQFVDNIVDYNRIAKNNPELEYFPRVIIAIDEVQEIFRDDNAAVLQKLISSISVRMRSAGMHFIMVAQNLCEGKSYMLKEAFLPSASGRICFRVAPNIPRDSGFDEEFAQRKTEIGELKTGEAYISYGKGTIKKVKMAYASPEDMTAKYFDTIKALYPEFAEKRPLVIGSKRRLALADRIQGADASYADQVMDLKVQNGIFTAVVGEDAYRMSPMKVAFSQNSNSATLILGDDKEIASSICATFALALMNQKACVHLFNGDRTMIQVDYSSVAHPFMKLCQKVTTMNSTAHSYRLNQLGDVLSKVYAEYLRRQKAGQDSDDIMPSFEPEFVIINDLFGIDAFVANESIGSGASTSADVRDVPNKYDFLTARSSAASKGQFAEGIQNVLATLLKNGYRYNIHVIIAIKGDPSVWRNGRIASEVSNVILFNTTQYAEQLGNSYYLKEMLRNIANENDRETMAVWAGKRGFSKIRPIIINLAVTKEAELFEAMIEGTEK